MTSASTTGEPDALLTALAGLVPFYGARAAPVLRKALVDLVASDATASPVHVAGDAATKGRTGPSRTGTAPSQDHRTIRRARAKPGSARWAKSNGSGPKGGTRLADCAWQDLRRRVREKMTADGVGFDDLGAAIGRAENTTRIALCKRTPPASSLSELFVALAGRIGARGRLAGERVSPRARNRSRRHRLTLSYSTTMSLILSTAIVLTPKRRRPTACLFLRPQTRQRKVTCRRRPSMPSRRRGPAHGNSGSLAIGIIGGATPPRSPIGPGAGIVSSATKWANPAAAPACGSAASPVPPLPAERRDVLDIGRRRPILTWQHHAEVAVLPAAEADA